MNFFKSVAISTILITSTITVSAQTSAQVKLTKYSAYTESDWGMDLSLKAGGKAVLDYLTYGESGKAKRISEHGTWKQEGDIVTVMFSNAKSSTRLVYQVKTQNSEPSMNCKGPYGLKPIYQGEADEVTRQHLWPTNLLKDKGPCI